jgi:hypothetical protein
LGRKNKNIYDLSGEYGIGYTANGDEFLFDLEDYEKIKTSSWHIICKNQSDSRKYVHTVNKEYPSGILLHRYILGITDSNLVVDHINHNVRDNRKENLRIVEQIDNLKNLTPRNNKSGVTGVYWDKRRNNWYSQITYNKKTISLGTFTDFDEAVKARKKAEEKYFGEYSYDNSMKEGVV